MHWLHHVVHDFDATRHFIAVQCHPGNWFGNIVAGVVVFVIINICWALFLKKWVHKFAAEVLKRHHEKIVQPAMDAHQAATHALLKKQHKSHLAAIRKTKENHEQEV